MLRYKTKTRPGLVALYDIRPGNGAGPFLQPWSPHGAGSPWNWVSAQGSEETRMVGYQMAEKSFKVGLTVLIQYLRVTDRLTDILLWH